MTAPANAQDATVQASSPKANTTVPYPTPGGLQAQVVGTESAYFSSNPLLQVGNTKSLWGSITAPEVILSDKTPTWNFNTDTTVDSNNFNQSVYDSTDVHSKLNIQKQTQKWNVGLLGNFDYDTTRSSEVSSFNTNVGPIRHIGGTANPDITYNILPTDRMGVAGSYTESDYATNGTVNSQNGNANSQFVSYNTESVTPSYSHDFNQLNTGTVSFLAQRYRTEVGPSNVIDTLGPSLGWTTIFTPNFTGNASAGVQATRQREAFEPSLPWKTQYDFSGNLTYKGDNDTIALAGSRSESPFGNGTEALLTQGSLNDTHMVNERVSFGFGGGYQSATYDSPSALGSLKSMATGNASLTYHITDHLDADATYQYRYETLVETSGNPQDNTVLLSLSYRPVAWHLR